MYVGLRDAKKTGDKLNFDEMPRDGECKGKPTEWFFPTRGESNSRRYLRENVVKAKECCRKCSINHYCLEYSLRHEPFGVWGGYDEQTRAVMRAERGISLSREGRIHFAGVGLRSADGVTVLKNK